jgi:hypothetical protein
MAEYDMYWQLLIAEKQRIKLNLLKLLTGFSRSFERLLIYNDQNE